jgi:hypothetical protein
MTVEARLISSFLVLLALATALQLASAALGAWRHQKRIGAGADEETETSAAPPRKSKRKFLVETFVIVPGLTALVTLGITLVLLWTGFLDSQFYRPSQQDYGQAAKLDVQFEPVRFTTVDGETLAAWWLPAAGEPLGTVIHFHGSDRNITYTVGHVHWLPQHGWNVLAFDYRGYGESTGEPSAEGLLRDGAAALSYVRERRGAGEPIVLYGQSLGGQLAIRTAAADEGAGGLAAVIAEATYADPSLHVADKLAAMGPLWLVQWSAWLVTSGRPGALDVIGDLETTPILLVHGTADRGCQPYHSRRLHDAAGEPKDLWLVDGAGHLRIFRDDAPRRRLLDHLAGLVGGEAGS